MRKGFVSTEGEFGWREGGGSACSTRLLYTSFASSLSEDCEENGHKKKRIMQIKTKQNKQKKILFQPTMHNIYIYIYFILTIFIL